MKNYERAILSSLRKLDSKREEFLLEDTDEKLLKYSPKYNAILNKINETAGTIFIYSEYKPLEGIAVLKIILKANGYSEFKLKKGDSGEYEIDMEEGDLDTPKFAFWGGDAEESDIIRRIYNNDFEELPVTIKKTVR